MQEYVDIETLEGNYWGVAPTDSTYLVEQCYILRTKPLSQLSIEDLRLLIGQKIGIDFIVGLAINFLRSNILVEGDMYPGDLLKNVLSLSKEFWTTHPELKIDLERIIYEKQNDIDVADLADEIRSLLKTKLSDFMDL